MKLFTALLLPLFLYIGQPVNETTPQAKSRLYISNYENVLGTSLTFKFTSDSETAATLAEQAALAEINRLSHILSAYDPDSEFNRWMQQDLNKPVKVSDELFEVLSLFEVWKARTHGALDPSAAVALKLWSDAARIQQSPGREAIHAAVSAMEQTHYYLDPAAATATRVSHVPLIMNTFAKSYIINKACDAALAAGNLKAAVVNIGGDLVIKGNLTEAVNVTDPKAAAENDEPLANLLVENKAVATSGNYRRGEQIGKKWYSHIIDPRTAKPVEGVISATVIAPQATDAGALATAFNILSLEESQALASTISGAEYLIITADGKKITSKGWSKFVRSEHKIADKKATASGFYGAEKPWDPRFELSVLFQLNVIAGNGHRPFAAIWVEDENRKPVRNLALWYNKNKWVPDLRNWYRINGERFKASNSNFASVTGATRAPGKYTIKWDGKDDEGNYVPQGKYTIIIESAKEHGTNEIIRQPMELKKAAKKVTTTGNIEISNVTFDFHKK